MNLKTIIIVSDFASVEGGATSVAIQTALTLAKYTQLKVFFYSAVGPVDGRLKNSEVNVICLEQNDILHDSNRLRALKSGLYNSRVERKFDEFLRKFDPLTTMVHVHTWTKALSSAIFKVIKQLQFCTLLTIHDYFLICPNGGLYNYQTKTICEKKPLSLSCIFCNCDSRHYYHKTWRVLRQIIQNKYIHDNPEIGYIFISDTSRHEIHKRSMSFRHQFFLQNPIDFQAHRMVDNVGNKCFAYIGRISQEKGVGLFCKAVDEIKATGLVIGDGPIKNKLKKMYSERIHFTGWLDHEKMQSYYKQIRCLVFPSRWLEVSPLTPLEVQAMGIPSIVPDRCAASEYIKNGENGLVFKTGDLEDLKRKMKRVMDNDNLLKKLSDSAYKDSEKLIASEKVYIKNLLDVYNKMQKEWKQKRK